MVNIIETKLLFNGGFVNRTSTKQIILHHAEASNCTVEDINRWHLNNGWTGIGYHYFVRKNGTIYRGRPENAIGAHAVGANTNSIGICAEGRYNVETMPEAQKNAIKELIADIKSRYGNLAVKGHKEVSNTSCPGKNYPLEELKSTKATNVIKKEEFEMKTYQNGATSENCYSNWQCTNRIGSLNPKEKCDCFGEFRGKAMIRYKVDGRDDYKIAFCKWLGGIQ